MLKSKIAPIIAGLILIIGAVLWISVIRSIDYTQMRERSSGNNATQAVSQQPQ